jgi:hypothetical protein
MKFLCIPCDSPMKLQTVGSPEGGSLSAVFSCSKCGYEMAMLTNPYETQLVQSLGVRIGPSTALGASPSTGFGTSPAEASAVAGVATATAGEPAPGDGCPFPAMIPAAEGAAEAPVQIRWTPGAEARLSNIPVFIRPMARTGIERFARERGLLEVDETILDAARAFFGM